MSTKYIVNNVSGQTITGDLTINGNVVITGTTNIRPYKVYTALLTQSGDGTSTQITGPLVVGKTYEIVTFETGDDFTNVANVVSGVINTNGCVFIATGTTPTDYSNGSELRDTSAPVATVLENTLGEQVVWEMVGNGNYITTINDSLINNTYLSITNNMYDVDLVLQILSPQNQSIEIATFDNGILTDGILSVTPIEIRVYN